jgi:hypothetical protein
LNLTSLNLSNQYVIPTNGLQAFSKRITTLTSFICCNIDHIDNSDLTLIYLIVSLYLKYLTSVTVTLSILIFTLRM